MSSSDVACADPWCNTGKIRRVFYPVALAVPLVGVGGRPGIRGASFRHRRSRGRAMVCDPDRSEQNQLRCGALRSEATRVPRIGARASLD